ncbi:hypothetical protein A464_2860 [Salmonella bongori N268-08]|uniref:Uncharacterized protein n=1 Tax=Salmonella bongori N268-08 TaxID=1197719 RepID=S5NBQ0_SALBN|nr:hypothetical protein A464_2860 [Salmonella bongori N268-08]
MCQLFILLIYKDLFSFLIILIVKMTVIFIVNMTICIVKMTARWG